jgi:hypothetical protein
MKHVIDRNGIRLTYTETFIESGKPDYIDSLDWNVIETELQPNFNFIKNKWNGSEWIEGATPEEIASQQAEILKQKETDLYIKRMQDAQKIWAGLSAEFRIAKQMGQMDDATENIILAELKPVLDIVVPFGQWVTGYQLLLGIGSSVIGQPLYDKIYNILWSYIQENYEEMEVEQLRNQINKK